MKAPGLSEQQIHFQVAHWLNRALPEDSLWWHTANQRKTVSPREGKKLKGMGVRPGMPDICILYRGKLIGIELKAAKKNPTDIQDAVLRKITLCGGLANVCRSLNEVSDFLGQLMPLRAKA